MGCCRINAEQTASQSWADAGSTQAQGGADGVEAESGKAALNDADGVN
jgi:hypothetical protein